MVARKHAGPGCVLQASPECFQALRAARRSSTAAAQPFEASSHATSANSGSGGVIPGARPRESSCSTYCDELGPTDAVGRVERALLHLLRRSSAHGRRSTATPQAVPHAIWQRHKPAVKMAQATVPSKTMYETKLAN
mmetsp:Transcript_34380/g.60836  ORF Transcript_34380/g.60836 Transcript_34380/m.60836 type:complete len:137 (-) Transcript_34380:66-476(-)